MFSEINNSKELIRNRMLKHALNYWNIKNTEDLDPVVKLILEALSSELYNLGNDIKDTEIRLLEKLANLLAPDFLTCPNAAHGILHAEPIEPQEVLPETNHFFTQKKISSKQDETPDTTIDIFFTPVTRTKLLNARVSCIATGIRLFVFDQYFNKQLVAQAMGGQRMENNVVWLGLTVDDRVTDLDGLFFYFDWKNTEQESANFNYQLLPLTKWYFADRPLDTTVGIAGDDNRAKDNAGRSLSMDYDLLSLMERDINSYYSRKFITIRNGAAQLTDQKHEYPSSFKNIFGESGTQNLNSRLVWIKIVFPAAIPQNALDDVYVYTNAFPVMNRQLNDMRYQLKGGSNIIPLRTSGMEQFLAVRSLADESHAYRATPFRKMEEEQAGTYTLRSGGVERFDARNAKEFISYLLELLRSESAAFSAYGNDFIASTLREMNQRIALMEQRAGMVANNIAEMPHYIIVKPYEGSDRMFAEYWITLAEMANTVRSGTRMQEYNSAKVKSDSVFLLTTTTGGKNRLKPEDRVNAFRYGLMTRNRIVTKEDIRSFCLYELGSRISKVTIERGVEISPHPKQAFRRTIDITLTAAPAEKLVEEGWQALLDQLKSKLQNRSGMSNHYRLYVSAQ